jgi:hypothetical protein
MIKKTYLYIELIRLIERFNKDFKFTIINYGLLNIFNITEVYYGFGDK